MFFICFMVNVMYWNYDCFVHICMLFGFYFFMFNFNNYHFGFIYL